MGIMNRNTNEEKVLLNAKTLTNLQNVDQSQTQKQSFFI